MGAYSSNLATGTIVIGGGTVSATGGIYAAGIGGGSSSKLGENFTITISGGNVNALGYSYDNDGAGIGNGAKVLTGGDFSGKIIITGGKIYATCGIGSGYGTDMKGQIIITGGNIEVKKYNNDGACIGAGHNGTCTGNVTIQDATVKLTKINSQDCAFIGNGRDDEFNKLDLNSGLSNLSVCFEGSTPVAEALRVSTLCSYSTQTGHTTVIIKPCEHDETGHIYEINDDATHTATCAFCGKVLDPEEHTIEEGCCICGFKPDDRAFGYSLSLGGNIGVNYHMNLSEATRSSSTAYMLFTLPDNSTQIVYVNQQADTSLPYAENGSDNVKIFKCNVPAKYIGCAVTAQIIDGDVKGIKYDFTVKEYAEYLIAHSDKDAFRGYERLARALLDYGAYAQTYFGITSALQPSERAIDNVTPETLSAYAYNSSESSVPDNVSFAGFSLSLESETTLSLYFTKEVDLTFTCTDPDVTVERRVISSYQIVRISGIKASQLANEFTVNFTGTGVSGKVTISPLAYCYSVVNNSFRYDASLVNVCKALYVYYKEAVTAG